MIDPTPSPLLTAANDNPGGTTEARCALLGLVDLLARAEARRGLAQDAANTNRAPAGRQNTEDTE
ncbi:hypothetical protein ROJ8625_03618 [Roseivivax jejudonensis]|uniref:Uncharacterized protein n=1 Tax=Roseivivax jejudonensis TaxID=1529041 RepID=A0A1X7A449_9RHOB|nr:hypothetical protein [Roseivivax jejudonensis]SLN69500.1 hypothetical protein ROJ8625_03618 [Roseivivax jejudonensis]